MTFTIKNPEHVIIESDVVIGDGTYIDGHNVNTIGVSIRAGSWIGPMCYMHGAGGVFIGHNVGIGPCVKIITSKHNLAGVGPIIHNGLTFAPVYIKDGADIGMGSVILPGVTIGEGTQIGAGSVVTHDIGDYLVAAGNPCIVLRGRSNEV